MNTTEIIALKWHLRSDHARDGVKFGSPICNCTNTAKRMLPFLMEAWNKGFAVGYDYCDESLDVEDTANPYWEAIDGA